MYSTLGSFSFFSKATGGLSVLMAPVIVCKKYLVTMRYSSENLFRVGKSRTHQDSVSNILFNIINFLFLLRVRKSVDMQYSHLLDYSWFAGLARPQEEQPVCGPVELFVLLQLSRYCIAPALLAFRVLRVNIRLLGGGWPKATHRSPRGPPTRRSVFLVRVGWLGTPCAFSVLLQYSWVPRINTQCPYVHFGSPISVTPPLAQRFSRSL